MIIKEEDFMDLQEKLSEKSKINVSAFFRDNYSMLIKIQKLYISKKMNASAELSKYLYDKYGISRLNEDLPLKEETIRTLLKRIKDSQKSKPTINKGGNSQANTSKTAQNTVKTVEVNKAGGVANPPSKEERMVENAPLPGQTSKTILNNLPCSNFFDKKSIENFREKTLEELNEEWDRDKADDFWVAEIEKFAKQTKQSYVWTEECEHCLAWYSANVATFHVMRQQQSVGVSMEKNITWGHVYRLINGCGRSVI